MSRGLDIERPGRENVPGRERNALELLEALDGTIRGRSERNARLLAESQATGEPYLDLLKQAVRDKEAGEQHQRRAGRERLRERRERSGHRREHDPRQPRRSFAERVNGAIRDVGTFRAVALRDLVARQFDGHPFAAHKAVAQLERRGLVERRQAQGPQGGTFTVLVATRGGAAAAEALWREAGRQGQRTFSGAVKAAEVGHDVAVYRAAIAAQERIEATGGRVTRVRIDAELKGEIAARGERARRMRDHKAGEAARTRAAADLGVPVQDGRVLVPDAQLEYVAGDGRDGRCNVEVASEHYRGREIRAKAKAGFEMYASSPRAAGVVQRALAGVGGGTRGRSGIGGVAGGRSGSRGGRPYEVFEL
ncbi:MAG: hypothetical protein F4Y94_05815 [Chloroflexi bacterium]|nr:hypothetical protein [Chloroflexota bacterium]